MAFAFVHLVSAWLLGKLSEKLTKKELHKFTWFFLLLGSLLPDIDFLLDWTIGTEFHRTFTHSLWFVLAAPLIVYTLANIINFKRPQDLAFALGTGVLLHIFVDMFYGHGVPLLWPSLLHFSWYGVSYFNPANLSFLQGSKEVLQQGLRRAIFDMSVGSAWILYLALRRRIKF